MPAFFPFQVAVMPASFVICNYAQIKFSKLSSEVTLLITEKVELIYF